MKYYILNDDHSISETSDRIEFEKQFPKIVKQETIDGYFISTVFLGIDHDWNNAYNDGGKPLLFETMIFNRTTNQNNYLDDYCERSRSYDQALENHKIAIDWVKGKK